MAYKNNYLSDKCTNLYKVYKPENYETLLREGKPI